MEKTNTETKLSYFDRAISNLHEIPDVVRTRSVPVRVIPPFGVGAHLYAVQTFRQKEEGDTIFLETVSDGQTQRIVIPPAVSAVIARQRDQLTSKSRSAAGKRNAEERKRLGLQPGFMKAKSRAMP